MKKVSIDLDFDTVEEIVRVGLEDVLDSLNTDLNSRKNGTGIPFFSTSPEDDIEEMTRRIDAIKLVLTLF